MKPVRHLTIGLAIATLMISALPVHAAAPTTSYRFEITPFAAYLMGGNFQEQDGDIEFDLESSGAFGFTLNGPAGKSWPDGSWEFLYTHQATEVDTQGSFIADPLVDIDIDYYQFGGMHMLDRDNVRPFIGMALGMARFDPRPGEYRAEDFFSASLGGGVLLNANKRFGLRLEARAYATFIDSNSEIFCESDFGAASCLIVVDSSTLLQWEARAGLVFRF